LEFSKRLIWCKLGTIRQVRGLFSKECAKETLNKNFKPKKVDWFCRKKKSFMKKVLLFKVFIVILLTQPIFKANAQPLLFDQEWLLQCQAKAARTATGDAQFAVLMNVCNQQAVPKMCRGLSAIDGPNPFPDRPPPSPPTPQPEDPCRFSHLDKFFESENVKTEKSANNLKNCKPGIRWTSGVPVRPEGSSLDKCVSACAVANVYSRNFGKCSKD